MNQQIRCFMTAAVFGVLSSSAVYAQAQAPARSYYGSGDSNMDLLQLTQWAAIAQIATAVFMFITMLCVISFFRRGR